MELEKVESVIIKGRQDFEKYQVLNIIEIKIKGDHIVDLLSKH